MRLIMILSCKNCGARIVYNPGTGRLQCEYCDSSFDISEYNIKDDYKEEAPVHESKIYGGDINSDNMECMIYRCSACGAEISVNGVEASTFCVYCGSPNVIFSRVARLKKPQKILPFYLTKQHAEHLIRKKINSGFFIIIQPENP
jgi:DNA-directed RNA polymerase subunit RPC12/RpoP